MVRVPVGHQAVRCPPQHDLTAGTQQTVRGVRAQCRIALFLLVLFLQNLAVTYPGIGRSHLQNMMAIESFPLYSDGILLVEPSL